MNPRLRFKRDDGTDYPDWEEKKLGEITEDIRGGFAFPINEQGKKTGELPFYKVSDMNHFNNQLYMNIAENNIDFNTARKLKCNPAHKDTIIFPKLGMAIKTNKKRILSKTSCYDNNIFGLIVNNKHLIPKFLYYSFVKLDLMDLAEMGNTIPSIRKSALENFVIKIPCLEEQNKIADFLSDIDEVILASDQEVKKFQELKKGAMQKIFSQEVRFKRDDGTDYPDWRISKLENEVLFLDYMRKPIEKGERKSGIYPYYGASGIIDYVEDYIFDEELILLSEDGANILNRNYRVCFLANGKYWVNNHAHVMKSKTGNVNKFICEQLESFDYTIYNEATAQPKLNQETCKNLKLQIPCLEEQQKIGDFLSDFDEAISLAKQELEKWKLLKKGLLQQMFV